MPHLGGEDVEVVRVVGFVRVVEVVGVVRVVGVMEIRLWTGYLRDAASFNLSLAKMYRFLLFICPQRGKKVRCLKFYSRRG